MLSTIPNKTANCRGTNSVATNVMIMTTAATLLVFQMVTACGTRRPWKPATISRAASAGMGTRSTSGATSNTTTATNSPRRCWSSAIWRRRP